MEQHADPRRAAARHIRLDHRAERPVLQMLALDLGVERDRESPRSYAHPEFDVLDARPPEAFGIKPAKGAKDVAPNRAEPSPESGCATSAKVVDVVVEEISEVGDRAAALGCVVVRPEDRCQLRIRLERVPDALERVRVHFNVRIDEHEYVRRCASRSLVPRCCRPIAEWLVHHHRLFRWFGGSTNRVEAPLQGRASISGRHDCAERKHRLIVGLLDLAEALSTLGGRPLDGVSASRESALRLDVDVRERFARSDLGPLRRRPRGLNVWVDIDNPPQARYLVPLAREFERRGHAVLLTARDHGETLPILREEGVPFRVVGETFGAGVPRKVRGLVSRALALGELLQRERRTIDVVITGSRSATLTARARAIPSFVIIDYEHVNLLVQRLSSAYIFHPDVIPATAFRRRGISDVHLLPFRGLKEDLTFHRVDLGEIAPFQIDGIQKDAIKILFRPPAEESHYYRSESRELALALIRHLAAQDVHVVLSPRDESQVSYLDAVPRWRRSPAVLEKAAPFASLLTSVDAVVSAGGTMLREAAYIGVPAYSIFRSRIGAVDQHLAAVGRLIMLASPADFSLLKIEPRKPLTPLPKRPTATEDIIRTIETGIVRVTRSGD
jgi:predicted glycosyltransferase